MGISETAVCVIAFPSDNGRCGYACGRFWENGGRFYKLCGGEFFPDGDAVAAIGCGGTYEDDTVGK